MHKHGHYWRSAVTGHRVIRIPIYRWRCPGCRGTVSVLPDFLAPYARVVSVVREGVVRRYLRGWPVARIAARACGVAVSGLSDRTVTRWLAVAKDAAASWTQVLTERLLLAQPGCNLFALHSHWQGPRALLQALCELGDLCRTHAPSDQGHPGLYAYCNGLSAGFRPL
jgi:hypothetical protein